MVNRKVNKQLKSNYDKVMCKKNNTYSLSFNAEGGFTLLQNITKFIILLQ